MIRKHRRSGPSLLPAPVATATRMRVSAASPGHPAPPTADPPATTHGWPTRPGRTAGAGTQAYHEVALGDGRIQVVSTDAAAVNRETAGLGARTEKKPQFAVQQAAGPVEPVLWEAAEFRDAESVRIARWILSDAGDEASWVKREASAQAAAIREAAERKTAQIRRQAAMQAAAIREAAERETAELRAALIKISAEFGGVAVDVTENLTSPAKPATKPGIRPGANRKGRQVSAMHKMVAAFVILSLVGTIGGTVEIAMHGFSFFLFRNAGAGAGNSRNLNENQGPGQPDAPGVHHKANSGR